MLSVGLLLDICFRLTVIVKNLSCLRRFGRCNKDYQDQCLVLVFDPLLSARLIFHKAYFSLVELNEMGLEPDPDGDASRSGPAVNI